MPQKILVTGGGGFLGSAICKLLVANSYQVRSFSRRIYPHLEALGVECVQGDLQTASAVVKATAGVDAVIHTAAKAGVWGRPRAFYQANVVGTRNVIDAMHRCGVKRLVYTSSPSVVFQGKDIVHASEKIPLASKHMASYPQTKAQAEAMVLAATEPNDGMLTVALRPHLIWGPGDPHILPRLGAMAKKGRLFQIGDGTNKVDVTFVDNAALAHVQALQALQAGAGIGGKAYFIGQDKPVVLWDFIGKMLAADNIRWQTKTLPYPLAYAAGALCEWLFASLGIYHRDPPMTRFAAFSLAKSHHFDHSAARRDFGYQPQVSTADGLAIMHSRDVA